ncbi:PhoH family protein [Synechococcus elongatus IITB7]|uniref:PhoH family protein n=1 Tax=Synechococcus elongatus TaxID=32046 RepID=UPI0030D4B04D
MKKTYVLDTNVLLHDPMALFRFEDNDLVIPITVIEEIDRFKKDLNERGRNARQISRLLDGFRSKGHLIEGITLDHGGKLRVVMLEKAFLEQLPSGLIANANDNAILAVALALQQQNGQPTILVTKDTNLRIKADATGLSAEDYESDKIDFSELYSGTAEVYLSPDQLQAFRRDGGLDLSGEFFPNQALTLIDETNLSHTLLGRYRASDRRVVPLIQPPKMGISRIHARNREQQFALDLLLDDNIQLVTLVGKAGTGKTLLAVAAGLHKVADERQFSRLLVSRPIFPMGRDLGFLPGDLQEKLAPWMQPIIDNLDFILGGANNNGDRPAGKHQNYQDLMSMNLLQIEPLTYIRGRSIPRQFMIVDEAQNLTPHEIKTILTRAGEGTKIVLTGDAYQIDNPYVDASSNGLTYVVEKFKNEAIAGHITLERGERSPLAELSANLL